MEARDLVLHQLKNIFCVNESLIDIQDNYIFEKAEKAAVNALYSFNNKYIQGQKINPFNGVMYTNYLYWLSRFFYENENIEMADKIYGLNKMMNSVDLFYAIKLPLIWTCEHPLGSVMGRADYGERFVFYQGCTVGGNRKDATIYYPRIGENVTMYSNSKVLGSSIIGNNVTLAANAYVINQKIPDNSIVFGQSPNIVIKEKRITQNKREI